MPWASEVWRHLASPNVALILSTTALLTASALCPLFLVHSMYTLSNVDQNHCPTAVGNLWRRLESTKQDSLILLRQKRELASCCIGPPGLKGFPGRDAREGYDGEPGKPGKAGRPAEGDSRLVCVRECPSGVPGRSGPQGPKGEKGAHGRPGAQGQTAPPSLRGEPGEPGEKGFPGLVGAPGENGEPGRIYVTDGPPGKEGDAGPRGPPGEKGKPGHNGEEGLPGQRGERGYQGLKGERGVRGPTGAFGPPGAKGEPWPCESCPPPRVSPGYYLNSKSKYST